MVHQLAINGPKRIFLWPAESAELRKVGVQLGHYGYETQLFAAMGELQAAETREPAVALVDCGNIGALVEADRTALSELARRVPLACMASSNDIASRLAAMRIGCQAYFTRPLDPTSLLDTLDYLTAPAQAETGRVLIIDDSPAHTAFYAAHLNDAGFVTQVVNDPLRSLDALDEHPPELILLDMNMPRASGEEIAAVIRQQSAYLAIPIVYLSAESDIGRQREAMSLGGDEFLEKPIQPQHLISAVKSRVIRYRALRAMIARDSLTGLLNHTNFKERLCAEIVRARRDVKPLAVALIDIDLFKKVNDRYGHPAGDRVIKSLARLLKQRLRGADLIGRYGGEEFALALPDTTGEAAVQVIDQIRERFASIVQHAGDKTFHSTLSAGVTAFVPGCDGESLIQAADCALYAAKHGGRNRVCEQEPAPTQRISATATATALG